MSTPPDRHLIRCFLRNRGEILVVQHDDGWDAISGPVHDDPADDAQALIHNLAGTETRLVREGNVLFIPGKEQNDYVYSFLFECSSRQDLTGGKTHEWIAATDLLKRRTTPELWASYAEVAPSIESITHDREHGASYLSIRALEVLRDWSGRLAWQQHRGKRLTEDGLKQTIYQLAMRLIDAKPTMAVLRNRINKVMSAAKGDITQIATLAHDALGSAYEAYDETVHRASQLIASQNVLTFSHSATAIDALSQCRPAATVYVPESLPDGEGVTAARKLAGSGCDVTMLPDSAVASLLASGNVDLILTGADTALPDGQIINKTGTHLLALAASAYEIPFYAVCSTDKISAHNKVSLDETATGRLQEKAAPLKTYSPLFEVVPAALISGIITEKGVLTPEAIEEIALALEDLDKWQV